MHVIFCHIRPRQRYAADIAAMLISNMNTTTQQRHNTYAMFTPRHAEIYCYLASAFRAPPRWRCAPCFSIALRRRVAYDATREDERYAGVRGALFII